MGGWQGHRGGWAGWGGRGERGGGRWEGEIKKREICQQHTSALCRSDTNSSQQYDLKHNRSFVKKTPRTKLNWHSVAGKSLQARPAFSEGKLTNATLAVATSSLSLRPRDLKERERDSDTHRDRDRETETCLLYTSPSPRDNPESRMPSSA